MLVLKEEHLKKYIAEIKDKPNDFQMILKFPNGYGASVVKNRASYGFDEGWFEIAVLGDFEVDGEGNLVTWNLKYDTTVTDDVLGHLDEAEVVYKLEEIKSL